jgi:hypothetical protein
MFEDAKGVTRSRQCMDRQYTSSPPPKRKGQKRSQKNKNVSNMITTKIGSELESSGRLSII